MSRAMTSSRITQTLYSCCATRVYDSTNMISEDSGSLPVKATATTNTNEQID